MIFSQKGNIMFVRFIHTYKKISYFHVLLEKDHLLFSIQSKTSYFPGKNTAFPDNTRKIIFHRDFFGNTIFLEHLKKIHISMWFLRMIIFHLFSEKINIICPDITTKKIICQCYFFGKTIFLEHLKEISYFHLFFLRNIIFHFSSKE